MLAVAKYPWVLLTWKAPSLEDPPKECLGMRADSFKEQPIFSVTSIVIMAGRSS